AGARVPRPHQSDHELAGAGPRHPGSAPVPAADRAGPRSHTLRAAAAAGPGLGVAHPAPAVAGAARQSAGRGDATSVGPGQSGALSTEQAASRKCLRGPVDELRTNLPSSEPKTSRHAALGVLLLLEAVPGFE